MLSQLKKATGSTSKYSQMSSQPAGTMPCMSTVATRSSVKASTRACVMAALAGSPSSLLAALEASLQRLLAARR